MPVPPAEDAPSWTFDGRLGPAREWGRGDHDQPYRFGRPLLYLTVREHARLLLVRGRLWAQWGRAGCAVEDGTTTGEHERSSA